MESLLPRQHQAVGHESSERAGKQLHASASVPQAGAWRQVSCSGALPGKAKRRNVDCRKRASSKTLDPPGRSISCVPRRTQEPTSKVRIQVLRIHFNNRDLTAVHIAPAPDPLWEAVLALHVLTGPNQLAPVALRPWRDRARTEVDERRLGGAIRMLSTLAPHAAGYFPDFLTPAEAVDGLEAGLGALRSTPRGRLASDIGFAAQQRPLPSWASELAAGDRVRLEELTDAIRLVHHTLIAPGWSEVAATVDADAAVRFRAWRAGGVNRLLDSLRPVLRWQPPVLEADYPAPMDLYLNGRGLRLIPSFFCFRRPVALVDHELPPVVVYPIDHAPTWVPSEPRARHPLALTKILGATSLRVSFAVVSGS